MSGTPQLDQLAQECANFIRANELVPVKFLPEQERSDIAKMYHPFLEGYHVGNVVAGLLVDRVTDDDLPCLRGLSAMARMTLLGAALGQAWQRREMMPYDYASDGIIAKMSASPEDLFGEAIGPSSRGDELMRELLVPLVVRRMLELDRDHSFQLKRELDRRAEATEAAEVAYEQAVAARQSDQPK